MSITDYQVNLVALSHNHRFQQPHRSQQPYRSQQLYRGPLHTLSSHVLRQALDFLKVLASDFYRYLQRSAIRHTIYKLAVLCLTVPQRKQ